MNRLFPLPVYSFVRIAWKNRGISLRGIKNLPPWLIKTILFEPLRWIELALYNKKIRRHTIAKHPIFILGFYRSGTSYLHQFLTQDDRLGYHSNFQMVLPEIMLSSEKVLSPFFDFICRTFRIQDSVHRLPLSFRFPGEEDVAMTTSLSPRGGQWGFFFPKKMNEIFHRNVLFENTPASEIEKWKREYAFLLKKFSLASRGKQLVLKSPPNTARIKLLLSLFPDAKFIFIHRHPYEVYLSNKRFWKVTQKVFALGGTKSVDINSMIPDMYSKIMHRYLSEKDLVPPGQLVEIPYEDLVQEPLESMRKIYETIQLDDFGYCEMKMKAYVDRQEKFVRLQHAMPADEEKAVAGTFEPFIRHWNYSL